MLDFILAISFPLKSKTTDKYNICTKNNLCLVGILVAAQSYP